MRFTAPERFAAPGGASAPQMATRQILAATVSDRPHPEPLPVQNGEGECGAFPRSVE